MLPPFIIDEIRKREEQRQSHQEQLVLELPIDETPFERFRQSLPVEEQDKPQRGVIIVDL